MGKAPVILKFDTCGEKQPELKPPFWLRHGKPMSWFGDCGEETSAPREFISHDQNFFSLNT